MSNAPSLRRPRELTNRRGFLQTALAGAVLGPCAATAWPVSAAETIQTRLGESGNREASLISLAGGPETIGTLWGHLNKDVIRDEFEKGYLKRAAAAGISSEKLIARSEAAVQIASDIAPHWLEEARATAQAAGVDETLYLAFTDGQSRNRFLHECTSYSVSRDHARDGAILFHKTRDNADRPQAAFIVQSSLPGINKFIAVANAGCIRCSMMVNDKGLAGAGDYPADRKKDSSTLELKSAEPRFRGLMAGSILRHIAERAATCAEALAIIEEFVAKRWYAGGEVNGSHWLFVDRQGMILEVGNNSEHVVSQTHTDKVYFSRLRKSPAAQRLAQEPVDFQTFRSVSRDKSICFDTSISGMTAEIHPEHPEWLTAAWVALPARAVAFPLLMGQDATPVVLADGRAYARGKQSAADSARWEMWERIVHAAKQDITADVLTRLSAGDPQEHLVDRINSWSRAQATRLFAALDERS